MFGIMVWKVTKAINQINFFIWIIDSLYNGCGSVLFLLSGFVSLNMCAYVQEAYKHQELSDEPRDRKNRLLRNKNKTINSERIKINI